MSNIKLGIITDIHNNIVALEAIIAELNNAGCEKIICAGDIIGIGPYPEETVQYIKSIPNLLAVRGNHEGYLIDGMVKHHTDKAMDDEEIEFHTWEHGLLSEDSIEFLRSLPRRRDLNLCDISISVLHYNMDELGHYTTLSSDPTPETLDEMFYKESSDIIIYGHNHKRCISRGKRLYINVGSLGCPASDRNIARAGILEITGGNINLQMLDVVYDVNKALSVINKPWYPAQGTVKRIFYGTR